MPEWPLQRIPWRRRESPARHLLAGDLTGEMASHCFFRPRDGVRLQAAGRAPA
jgi:hypothetical protein